jgi:hypothetical protein
LTKINHNREAFPVPLHLRACIEPFDLQCLEIAVEFSGARLSLRRSHGSVAHFTRGSFGRYRSVRQLADRVEVSNAQHVPLDSVSDRLK